MTKKNISKNTKLLYKRNKRNTQRNMRRGRYTQLTKYNIKTQHAGGWWPFKKKPHPPLPSEDELTHVWYRNWPDYGVPQNMEEFRTFIYTLHKNFDNQNFVNLNNDDSIIIHCSAGVGRSGVVLIILQLLYEYKYTGIITDRNNGIYAITILYAITEARKDRMKLVQGKDQFIFICNFFNINPSDENITTFENLEKESGKMTTIEAKRNNTLNRYTNILPYDKKIVKLTNNKYVNASTMEDLVIDGKTIKIILAQCPIANTVQDFLQMCCEKKVRLIIMLTSLVEKKLTGLVEKITPKCDDYMKNGGLVNSGLNKLLEDNKKHVLYTVYKLTKKTEQTQLTYIPEFVSSIPVPVLIEEGYVPKNTKNNNNIFNNPKHLLEPIALGKNKEMYTQDFVLQQPQQLQQQQRHKVVLETMDNKLSKIGKQIRLKVIANLTNNPKSSNTFIDTLYTAMILTEETKLTLKNEFEKYLKLQITTTKRPKNINNKKTRDAQIKANIEAFNKFIDNFNNNIKEEQDTLKKALTNYGSAKLISVLTSNDAAELTSSA